ncbi:MAG TPA: transposase [Lacunisphaera sp.]|nr:transposase [Lacunisphaera sp.]
MLATKTKEISRPAPAGIELIRTLGAVLEMENSQLAAFENRGLADYPADAPAYAPATPREEIVDLPLPVSKGRTFAPTTAILRRHGQGKSSLEEAMLELYHANISVAGAEDVARQLWGEATGLAAVCECSRDTTGRIQAWLQRELAEPQVYVFFQSIEVKQKIRGESRSTRLAAVVGVSRHGTRQVLSVMAEPDPVDGLWDRLIRDLKRRGLRGVELFIGENDPAARAAVAACYPAASYQGCLLQFEREVGAKVRPNQIFGLRQEFDKLRASATEAKALKAAKALAAGLRKAEAHDAADMLERSMKFQYTYLNFPEGHHARLYDVEPLRRVLREFRETNRLIGPVTDDNALILMLAARLRHTARQSWARRRYIAL